MFSNVEDFKRVKGKYIWKHDFKDQYQDALQFSTSQKLTTSNTKITECSSNDDIQTCLSDFSRIIDDISSPIFKNVKQKYGEEISNNTSSNRSENTWSNDECKEKKYYFLHTLNKYWKLGLMRTD